MSQLIVLERTGDWADALARELAPHGIRPRQTRHAEDCEAALTAAIGGVVALACDSLGLERAVELIEQFGQRYPGTRIMALAPRSWQKYEWLLREAGAAEFVTSSRQLPQCRAAIVAHLARAPHELRTDEERVWAALPWSAVSSSNQVED